MTATESQYVKRIQSNAANGTFICNGNHLFTGHSWHRSRMKAYRLAYGETKRKYSIESFISSSLRATTNEIDKNESTAGELHDNPSIKIRATMGSIVMYYDYYGLMVLLNVIDSDNLLLRDTSTT